MRVQSAQRDEIGGWSVSLVLHVILLSVIWPALQRLPAPVPREPFRLNVTLVQSQQPSATVEPSGGESLLPQDVRAVDAATQNPASPRPARPSLNRSSNNKGHMTVQPVAATRLATAPVPLAPDTSPKTPDAVPLTPSITEPMPVPQASPPLSHETVGQIQRLVGTAPVEAEPLALTALPRELETTPSLAPAGIKAPAALHEPSDPLPGPPAPVPSTVSSQLPDPRADYSWLQRAVSRRLEELKRYSQPSLGTSTRLKVLVKAVVSNSGELMETEVVTSSGLARIDQEAVALVQRAFPVSLDEVIDRPQIVMRIPITYSRD
jgi:periplasmic protein TonB